MMQTLNQSQEDVVEPQQPLITNEDVHAEEMLLEENRINSGVSQQDYLLPANSLK